MLLASSICELTIPHRPDGGAYSKEKAAIDAANPTSCGDTLFGITVGSEGMYRGTYDAQDLIGWISDVRKSYPNVSIGTADTWNCWANGTMDTIITSDIDLVYVPLLDSPTLTDIVTVSPTGFHTGNTKTSPTLPSPTSTIWRKL